MSGPDELRAGRLRRARRPTLVDVARQAGVGLRTASRVVNGDSTVGAPLAERVREAVRALNYEPDERARQLRSGHTATVGVAMRSICEHNPVLKGIETAARDAGLTVVAMSTDEDEQREREAVMSMCRRRMDGVIIEPIGDDFSYLQPEIDSGLPLVAIDRVVGGIAVDTVVSDNFSGVRQAYEHLRRQGHRRIGYVGDEERIYTGRQRAEAFRSLAGATGNPVDVVHAGPVDAGTVAGAVDRLMGGRRPVSAIVTGCRQVTTLVIRELGAEYGRVAVVGFDDFPLAELLRPALTVVAQGDAEIGRSAVEFLRARLAQPGRPVQFKTVPTELVVRASAEFPPRARSRSPVA